ncbi:hypothetical protein CWI36_0138p0020 [Hamiltosporidium magnivora]|uniref:Lipoprotein n=1 Tax=Hamiltosporidium magnivora TaxID=148818 RepID=A0A4Q9LJP8_9MICR|nr:hypothetical protein CWI36_0138p0020 [Hamiltosporidium magnivora]
MYFRRLFSKYGFVSMVFLFLTCKSSEILNDEPRTRSGTHNFKKSRTEIIFFVKDTDVHVPKVTTQEETIPSIRISNFRVRTDLFNSMEEKTGSKEIKPNSNCSDVTIQEETISSIQIPKFRVRTDLFNLMEEKTGSKEIKPNSNCSDVTIQEETISSIQIPKFRVRTDLFNPMNEESDPKKTKTEMGARHRPIHDRLYSYANSYESSNL